MTEPGYKLDKKWGLTAMERLVLSGLVEGRNQTEIAVSLSVTRQRIAQLVKSLEKKGVLTREGEKIVVTLDRDDSNS